MAMTKKAQNVATIAVAGIAIVFAVLALLVKLKIIGPEAANKTTTSATSQVEIGSTIVEKSTIDENGDIIYYTAVETYTRGDAKALHWYPTTTKEPTTTEPEYSEVTEIEDVTDENGEPVTDEEGNRVTKVNKYTVAVTTTKPQSTVQVTDENGEPVTNENGEPVTEISTKAAEAESSTEETTAVDDSNSITEESTDAEQ